MRTTLLRVNLAWTMKTITKRGMRTIGWVITENLTKKATKTKMTMKRPGILRGTSSCKIAHLTTRAATSCTAQKEGKRERGRICKMCLKCEIDHVTRNPLNVVFRNEIHRWPCSSHSSAAAGQKKSVGKQTYYDFAATTSYVPPCDPIHQFIDYTEELFFKCFDLFLIPEQGTRDVYIL